MRFSFHFAQAFFVLLSYASPLWGTLALLVCLGGCLLAVVDGLSIGTGIYFAWITATTIGYGDFVPATATSRFLAVLIAFIGMPLNGLIVAISLLAAKLSVDRHGRLSHLIQASSIQDALDFHSTSDDVRGESSAKSDADLDDQ
jgi:voltage-gated potassium channel